MARRVGHYQRGQGETMAVPATSHEPRSTFVPPWLLGALILVAGLGAHRIWGNDPRASAGVGAALTVVTIGLAWLTWQYATPRVMMSRPQMLIRGHTTVTVLLCGGQALALFGYGPTAGTLFCTVLLSVAIAVSHNIRWLPAIRDLWRIGGDDQTALALGIQGAHVHKVHEDDDKVITEIEPAIGQSHKDVQKIAEPLATATHASVGGVRATVKDDDAGTVTITRMKRDVLAGVHPWPGVNAEQAGRSFADEPWSIGPREDGTVAHLWLPGRGDRAAGHLKIAGVTGSGKGETFRVCAAQTMTCRDVLFWLVDTAKPYQTARSIEHGLDVFATDMPHAVAFIKAVRKLITYRSEKLGRAGWDQWDVGCPTPAIVLWVEEGAAVFGEDGEWVDDFKRIGEEARSVGIFIVVSIQRWHGGTVDTNIRASLSSTLCFGCDNDDAVRMVLSEETLDAGAMPTWGNRKVGVCYVEATDVPTDEWSMKVKGWLGSADQLEATVTAGAAVRCGGLPEDEAAVMGAIYAELHRNHTATKEVAMRTTDVPEPVDEDELDLDGLDEELDQVIAEAVSEGIDPDRPLSPYDPERDGADGLTYPRPERQVREFASLEEEKRAFAEMVRGLVEQGHTELTYELLMEHWPGRSQPTIGRRMRELEDQGQVRRATPRGKRFAKAHWEPVALVTTASA